MARRALSLHARQLLAACLGLVAFLGFTGVALDHAFREAALSNMRERLQNHAYSYLSDFEFTRYGQLIEPPQNDAPDARFLQPGSGLYAMVRGAAIEWDSPSVLGRSMPAPSLLAQGEQRFEGPLTIMDGSGQAHRLYRFSYGLAWEQGETGGRSQVTRFTIAIFEDTKQLELQIRVFRRALWGYLGLAAGLLLLVQVLALRWSLQPLRYLERELARVQRGVSARLSGRHPPELETITTSINALIESENANLDQSRNTLADLAHSLKTPLAVLRARLEADDGQLRAEVAAQVQRMNEIVSYQLARAARGGHALFAAPVPIEPRAEEIVASLEKVYAGKGVLCEFEVDPDACFYGELGDLQELIGNLLENAFKWAGQRVLLTVRNLPTAGSRRPGVMLSVEDDGKGIADEDIERLLQRGVRGDERVQGHGIGLAIVQDIVSAYRGELVVDRSEELGGARFMVRLTPEL
jgi:two-component system sensor histidine kinase PhoQ